MFSNREKMTPKEFAMHHDNDKKTVWIGVLEIAPSEIGLKKLLSPLFTPKRVYAGLSRKVEATEKKLAALKASWSKKKNFVVGEAKVIPLGYHDAVALYGEIYRVTRENAEIGIPFSRQIYRLWAINESTQFDLEHEFGLLWVAVEEVFFPFGRD